MVGSDDQTKQKSEPTIYFTSSSDTEAKALMQTGFAFSLQIKETLYDNKLCKMLVFKDQSIFLNQLKLCLRCSSLKHYATKITEETSEELNTHLKLANMFIEKEENEDKKHMLHLM